MAIGTRELLTQLKIDPEFEGKIPPLTEAEFQQLRENILEAGEVYEPIRVWNGVVVDGHNRLKVIREKPEIRWSTREMTFADKWAAFDWMYRNQLGRRNLTDEQRTYMIGKMYEVRKKTIGGQSGNDNAAKRSAQTGQIVSTADKETHGVSGEIAMELNIGRNTVRRAEKFAKGVDALKQFSPDAADKVLKGQAKMKGKSTLGNDIDVKVNKKDIAAIATASPEIQQQAARALEKGEALPAMTTVKPGRGNGKKPAEQQMSPLPMTEQKPTESDSEAGDAPWTPDPNNPYDVRPSGYCIDDLVEEVKVNGEDYIRGLRTLIEMRFPQFDKAVNRMKIRREIDVIIEGFTILKEELQ